MGRGRTGYCPKREHARALPPPGGFHQPGSGRGAPGGQRGRRERPLRRCASWSDFRVRRTPVLRRRRATRRAARRAGARIHGRRRVAVAACPAGCAGRATGPTAPTSTPTWGARSARRRCSSSASRRWPSAGRSRVLVVGHSLGGMLARGLAVRRPDLVAGIVTLGSPMLAPAAHHASLTRSLEMLIRLGRAGIPGLMSEDCVAGSCARASFDEARSPLPRRRRLHRRLLQARRHRRLEGLRRPAGRAGGGHGLAHRSRLRPAGRRRGGGGPGRSDPRRLSARSRQRRNRVASRAGGGW